MELLKRDKNGTYFHRKLTTKKEFKSTIQPELGANHVMPRPEVYGFVLLPSETCTNFSRIKAHAMH